MLSFVNSLKQVIADIQITGGAIIERDLPSSALLQRLRAHVVQSLVEAQERSSLLEDWFVDGFFEEKIRVSIVHLHKLGIEDNDFIYRIMIKVLNTFVKKQDVWQH